MTASKQNQADKLIANFTLLAARDAAAADLGEARRYLKTFAGNPKKQATEARRLFDLTANADVREDLAGTVFYNLDKLVAADPAYAISAGQWCEERTAERWKDCRQPLIIAHVLAAALTLQRTQPKVAAGAAIWVLSCQRKDGETPPVQPAAMRLLTTVLANPTYDTGLTLDLADFIDSKGQTIGNDNNREQVKSIAADGAASALLENWKRLSNTDLMHCVSRLSSFRRNLSPAAELALCNVAESISPRIENAAIQTAQNGNGLLAARALLTLNNPPFEYDAQDSDRRSELIGKIVPYMPMRDVFALWADDRVKRNEIGAIIGALKLEIAPFTKEDPGVGPASLRAQEIITALATPNASERLRRSVLPLDKPEQMQALVRRVFPSASPT